MDILQQYIDSCWLIEADPHNYYPILSAILESGLASAKDLNREYKLRYDTYSLVDIMVMTVTDENERLAILELIYRHGGTQLISHYNDDEYVFLPWFTHAYFPHQYRYTEYFVENYIKLAYRYHLLDEALQKITEELSSDEWTFLEEIDPLSNDSEACPEPYRL